MSNSLRNSIALFVLLLILLAITLTVHRRLEKKSGELVAENNKTAASIAVLLEQISKIDSLKAEYEMQKLLQAQQSKLIVGADSSSSTYQYLLRILGWIKRRIPFDFAMSEAKKDTAYREYVINGRTDYINLLRLTKQLEYQRAVITIEDLSIGMDTIVNSDTVAFSMILRTHFQEGGPEMETITKKILTQSYSGYQLFKSRIYETIPPGEISPSLVEIGKATLIGIAGEKAFLRDGQGIIRILSLGDRVAYGYLFGIDMEAGKAIFKLNPYGLDETHILETKKRP
ncbi:MAG: hypothetical protein Q8M98_00335 [Candidatus Cloacimonadaceae bacterium]|nr:hypothetical protein [Candidatus Cloacimonadaceae bacterium]MDP3113198.1 hypothetical protein [Candidatus Cloacimonadaceae bacterium]